MSDLIDAEIEAVKRQGHKDPAKRKEQEPTYFIDKLRKRKEEEERIRQAALAARAKKLAQERKERAERQERENKAVNVRSRDRERSDDRSKDKSRGRSPVRNRRYGSSGRGRRTRSISPRRYGGYSRRSAYRRRSRSRSRSREARIRRSRERSRRRSRSRSRNRSVDRRRRRRRRSKSSSRSSSRERDRVDKAKERKKTRSKDRGRNRSRSSSSSSQSSTASTALIQKILAQNPKGAMAVQQHKSQKNMKAETANELIKAQAIALTKGAEVLSNSPMEMVKRQLYVGNLPVGIQPHALVDFLNEAMISRKLNKAPGNPFLKVNLNNGDGSFGFATLRNAEETDIALIHLNGIACLGQGLKLGRPKNYEGSGPSADKVGIPLKPLNLAANDAQSLLTRLEEKLQQTYKETGVPSPVICIANMLNDEMINDKSELEEIKEEVMDECNGYGTVVEVRMPKVGEVNNPYVFVHMSSKAEAEIACDKLSGRSFDNRALKVTFADLEMFKNGNVGAEKAQGQDKVDEEKSNAEAVPMLNGADAADID